MVCGVTKKTLKAVSIIDLLTELVWTPKTILYRKKTSVRLLDKINPKNTLYSSPKHHLFSAHHFVNA